MHNIQSKSTPTLRINLQLKLHDDMLSIREKSFTNEN